ncbi:hypothetical protein DAEQUDRAFT_490691 [Daedalea quercina L-15889]|uniref:Uncharacterized protein n=1 Tax=Daedalea quercina L-15889 TaxID=1314783 RepID=A0A165MP58_9APHY|nr:hypothetical protein DAEQUDRAFT_490691 [Daedalea quercina L-15889]
MQDSDEYDYFDELTEADLAAAEEVENRYIESQRTQQALQREPSGTEQPPAKRQKTGHPWNNTGVQHTEGPPNGGKDANARLARSSSLHSAAAILPDVPLANGYFKPAVQFDRNGRSNPVTNIHTAHRQPSQPSCTDTLQPTSVNRNNSYSTVQPHRVPAPQVIRPAPAQRPLAPPIARSSVAQRAATPSVPRSSPGQSTPTPYAAAAGRVVTPPISRPPVQRTSPLPASRPIPAQRQPSGLRVAVVAQDDRLQKELEEMRLQLEALRQEQVHAQESLRRAEDARMAKEGEVSILRKGIQKTAQEHAAEIAKIKAAKEAAEAMQLKIQNEKKEEIDRLKTQYTFKQHELETSGRSSPWTARSRKISRQAPPTPVRMPSQMREWNPLGIDNDATGLISFNGVTTSTQQPNGAKQGHEPRQTATEKPKMPGFMNAFDSSSPRPSQGNRGKPRQDAHNVSMAEESDSIFFSQPLSQRISPPRLHQSPPSPPSSPLGHKQAKKNARHLQLGSSSSAAQVQERTKPPVIHDIEMVDAQKEEAETEVIEEFPTMDWVAEVQRIILTHKRPSSKHLTMQLLMGNCLPDATSQEQREAYGRLSKSLLENMGVMLSDLVDADYVIRTVLDILVQMADVLQACAATNPLTGLVNMLRVLVLWLPTFSQLMFVRQDGAEDAGDMIFEVMCRIICAHLTPAEGERSGEFEELARETLGLLEDVAWVISDEYDSHLASVSSRHDVMSVLLAPSHPTWFLYHSVRVLILIASHHSIFRSLLSIPDSPTDSGEVAPKDFSRIPHIEQMAVYLRDTSRTGPEADNLRDAVMTFVATLCVAHPDAVRILQQSHMLIPSVLAFLSNITTPLFEEDPEFLSVSERVDATAMRSVRTVSVLYALVFGADSVLDLYNKLRRVSPRDIPSMYDLAVVTLGRLSWADPPIEASEDARNLLDQALDLSRALLELFVEGPLLELVWSAFQPGYGHSAAAEGSGDLGDDDEEEEARLQHPPVSQEV